MTMNKVYNKKEFKREIEKRTDFRFTYVTFYIYEKKGYFKPSLQMKDGKRTVSLYQEQDIDGVIAKLTKLKDDGVIKIRTTEIK